MPQRKLNTNDRAFTVRMLSTVTGQPACGLGSTLAISVGKNGGATWVQAAQSDISERSIPAPTWAATPITGESSTGGFLTQGSVVPYFVTAGNSNGESDPSPVLNYTVPSSGTSTNQATLNANAVAGANIYRFYRGNPGFLIGSSPTPAFTDVIQNAQVIGTPTVNTTSGGVYSLAPQTQYQDVLGELILIPSAPLAYTWAFLYEIVPFDPDDVADGTDVAGISSAIAGLPTLSQITTVVAAGIDTVPTITEIDAVVPSVGEIAAGIDIPTPAEVAAAVLTNADPANFGTAGSLGAVVLFSLRATPLGTVTASEGPGRFTCSFDAEVIPIEGGFTNRKLMFLTGPNGQATAELRAIGSADVANDQLTVDFVFDPPFSYMPAVGNIVALI